MRAIFVSIELSGRKVRVYRLTVLKTLGLAWMSSGEPVAYSHDGEVNAPGLPFQA